MNAEGFARLAFEAAGNEFGDWPNLIPADRAPWLAVGSLIEVLTRKAVRDAGRTGEDAPGSEPQPAPELAAAMDAPAALARVLSWFEQFGTRRTAIATRAQLAHAHQDGGLTVPEELRRFL